MDFFLVWIFPPLLGGVIGYVTNALAVKMLFRPLTEKRVFGVRIPFTPGILPRERHALAESLGDVVSNDLLTEEVLRARLGAEDLRQGVTRSIRQALDGFLDSSVSSVRAASAQASPLISEAAGRAYRALTAQEAFRSAVSASVNAALEAVESLRLGDLLAPAGRSVLTEWFREPGRPEITAEKARQAVLRQLEKAAAEGKALGDILPLQTIPRAAGAALDAAYPAFVSAARGFLAREDVRKELERYGGSIVRRAVGRLSPLQRLFVSAAQYDKAILESMPATVADLAEAAESFLSEETTRERFRSLLLEKLKDAIERPLASRPQNHSLSPEGLSNLVGRAVRAIGENQAGRSGTPATCLGATVGELLDSLGPEAREGVARAVGAWLAGLFLPGSGGGVVGAFASTFPRALLDGLDGVSVGTATGWDADFRDSLSRTLAEKGIALAIRQASGILKSLDVRRIVVEKIDGLDMLAIERIMLRVMAKELSGITWLGGILGVIIGALQLLVGRIQP